MLTYSSPRWIVACQNCNGSISIGRALSRLGISDTIRKNLVDGIPDKEITLADAKVRAMKADFRSP